MAVDWRGPEQGMDPTCLNRMDEFQQDDAAVEYEYGLTAVQGNETSN